MNVLPTKSQWKKWSLPSRLSAIGAFVGIAGFILTILFYLFPNRDNHLPQLQNINSAKPGTEASSSKVIINDQLLPINKARVPILDNNIYVGQYFASFMLGGVNQELLEVGARYSDASALDVFRRDRIKMFPGQADEQFISIRSIFNSPYIEFKYRNNTYSIKIRIKYINKDEADFYFTLAQIDKPTMVLKAFNELRIKEP